MNHCYRNVNYWVLLSAVCLALGLIWLLPGSKPAVEPMRAVAPGIQVPAAAAPVAVSPAVRQEVLNHYGQVPLHFELNQGQTAADVQFLARGPGYALFLTPQEVVWTLRSPGTAQAERTPPTAAAEPTEAVVRMGFVGAAESPPVLTGLDPQPGHSNYFTGNDPARWRTAIPQFGRVRYQGLYPGVDLVLYGNPQQMEYDFMVAPGADPGRIRLVFSGIEQARLDHDGQLVLQVSGGELVHYARRIYQLVNGKRWPVAGQYVLEASPAKDTTTAIVGFQVAAYDPTLPLVIDPSLAYSTHLSGSSNEEGRSIAVDAAGNAYVTGYTTSTDFPTANAFQPNNRGYTNGGYKEVFVTKLDATGQTLLYSTYLGGSNDDEGHGIAVDAAGNAYITGYTYSPDFPIAHALQSSNQGYPYNSSNAFVTKLDATGQTLLYSTYLGGHSNYYYPGDRGNSIAVDAAGNAYIIGSADSTDFPIANALQPNRRGSIDVFVTKLNATGQALLYSTYLGGTSSQEGYSIAVDTIGNAYITGYTYSTDFPTTVHAFQPNQASSRDAFVTKLSANGQTLLYSTYLGGNSEDYGFGIAVDTAGNAYITGLTRSTDFPTANALQANRQGGFDNNDAFVTKLDATGQTLFYSTYLVVCFNDSDRFLSWKVIIYHIHNCDSTCQN